MIATPSTSPAETRPNRSAWLTLALAIALLLFSVADLAIRFRLPTDGWSVFEGEGPGFLYVEDLMGNPSGLRPGDRVIAIEGHPAEWQSLSPQLKDHWQAGATLDYTVVRSGQQIQVPVTLAHWDLRKWLASLLQLKSLAGVLPYIFLLTLAAFVFRRRPGDPTASAFLLLMSAIASSSLRDTLPNSFPEWIDPTAVAMQEISNLILVALYPFTLIRFALVFPHPKPILQRFPWLAYAPLAIGLLLHALLPDSPLGWFWFVLSFLLAVSLLIHNTFTMRDAVSRAQLLWGLGGLIFGLGTLALLLLAGTSGLVELNLETFNLVPGFAITVMGVMLAVAILRYRLWDIDVIIRRTLIYGTLTVSLALLYAGSVVILQQIFRTLTGSANQSQLAIVVSTLAVAALFNPLRKRVQERIDRRFFRQKYDAERILADFAESARQQTDLDALTGQLVEAVQSSLQPEKVSIWLKMTGEGKKS